MQRDAVKVFLAVAFGIGIGILTGRALPIGVGWLIGAAVGGVIGYLMVAPIVALRAVPRAWVAVRGMLPSSETWEEVRWWGYACASAFLLPVAAIIVADLCATGWNALVREMTVSVSASLVAMGLLFLIPTMCCVTGILPEESDPRVVTRRLFLPVVLFYHLPRGFWWLATVGLPWFGRFARRLGAEWLRLVHSNLRMLCLADAFLFTGIGTIVGGPILAWMIAGGSFGVLNYEVVSVRFYGQRPVLVRRR